jgi:PAS domain S-box-containing protein
MDSESSSPALPPDRGLPREGPEIVLRLVEHSLGLMCIHDLEGVLLFVNAAAAESLGFRPEEGVGLNLRRFLSPSVEGQFDAYLQRIRNNAQDSGLMRLVARDGTERIWMYRNVLHEEPGMSARVLGHALDVTDRVRAERALRESERRFRLLADTAPVLIWLSNPNGHSVFLNQPWLDFTGRTLDEQLGAGWLESIHPADRDHFLEAYRGSVAARTPLRLEYRLRRADGEYRWVLGSGLPRIESDGTSAGLVGSSLDVTEIRQAREVLERARDELTVLVAERTAELRQRNEQLQDEMERRAQIEEELARVRRLESLGVLAGGLANEFDNLLSVIVGRSHSLFERFQAHEPARRDLESIQHAAQRAAGLIQQLLEFARKQPFRPQPFNLNQLLTALSLAAIVPGRVELSLRLTESLRPAIVDPGQIQRAMLHLVENACDAMPEGGRLVLETGNVDLDEAFVQTHPGSRQGPHVRLTVRDTGTGMDEATRSRIFEPFFSAGRRPEGGHLGLAAVYGITKQHGGYIAVESEPGRGTAFTLYLPASDEAAGRVVEIPTRPPRGPEGSETVLLVEDEEAVRLLLRDILQLHGYRVIDVSDSQEALALASQRSEPIHLLLADVTMMRRMSGPTLAERLSVARPGLKVLYVSGYTADTLGEQGVLNHGVALLEKPFTMMTLLRKVRDVLDG